MKNYKIEVKVTDTENDNTLRSTMSLELLQDVRTMHGVSVVDMFITDAVKELEQAKVLWVDNVNKEVISITSRKFNEETGDITTSFTFTNSPKKDPPPKDKYAYFRDNGFLEKTLAKHFKQIGKEGTFKDVGMKFLYKLLGPNDFACRAVYEVIDNNKFVSFVLQENLDFNYISASTLKEFLDLSKPVEDALRCTK